MSEEEKEEGKSYTTSFRLNESANARLMLFCELTGMRKSEVVKAAISQFIAPTIQNANVIPPYYNPRAHTCVDNNIISKDIINTDCFAMRRFTRFKFKKKNLVSLTLKTLVIQ